MYLDAEQLLNFDLCPLHPLNEAHLQVFLTYLCSTYIHICIQQGFVVLCVFVPESRGNGGKPATGFQSKNSMQNFKIGTGKGNGM